MNVDIAHTTGPETRIVNCDGCGKLMTDPKTAKTIIGVCITKDADGPDAEFIQRQFGPLTKDVYSFCYECWLRSLGAVAPANVVEGAK